MTTLDENYTGHVEPGTAARRALPGARLTLDVRIEPTLPAVVGQRDQLQQMILNLLTNAIDATPPDGRPSPDTGSRVFPTPPRSTRSTSATRSSRRRGSRKSRASSWSA